MPTLSKISYLCAFALVGSLFVSTAVCAAPERLEYTLIPQPERHVLVVELNWQTISRTESTLSVQPHWASVRDVPALLQDVVVEGGQVQRDGARWLVTHEPNAVLRCRYVVKCQAESNWNRNYCPIATDKHFHGIGETFLITPPDDHASDEADAQQYDVSMRWELPQGWSEAVSSLGAGREWEAELPMRELRHAVYLAGDIQTSSQTVGTTPVTVAVAGDFDFTIEDFMSLCARILDVEQRFMSDVPLPPYLITVVEIGHPLPKGSRSMGGTGLTRSFATFLPPQETINDGLEQLLAHELFHHWNGRVLDRQQPEELVYWFSEGFTEYYALRLLYEANIWDERVFCRWLNRHLSAYHQNPAMHATNEEIRAGFWSDRDTVGQVAYQRGFLLGIRWHELAAQRGVEDGVDALFRSLVNRAAQDGMRLSNEQIRVVGVETLGAWFAEEFERYVVRAETVEVPDEALAPTLQAKMQPVYALDFGFDRDRLREDRLVRGLDPESTAAKAGLREGDELIGWSIFDDVDRESELQVRRDGDVKTVRYFPRGPAISIKQFVPAEE